VIVLDASAAVEFVLGTPIGQDVRDRLGADPPQAPHLIDAEVTQVLRRFVFAGTLTADRGREALDDFTALRVFRYPHGPLLHRVWELRDNSTAYDAMYLALAEALDAPLLTTDARLATVPAHRAVVEILPPPT